MSKVRIELNLAGINECMKSKPIQDVLQECGEQVAARAAAMDGTDYAATTHLANWIAVTNVYPNSKEAAHANFEHGTLLKALGG